MFHTVFIFFDLYLSQNVDALWDAGVPGTWDHPKQGAWETCWLVGVGRIIVWDDSWVSAFNPVQTKTKPAGSPGIKPFRFHPPAIPDRSAKHQTRHF
jgi:hypothetical protein